MVDVRFVGDAGKCVALESGWGTLWDFFFCFSSLGLMIEGVCLFSSMDFFIFLKLSVCYCDDVVVSSASFAALADNRGKGSLVSCPPL
jgi:hypothetical protein